MAYIGRRDLFGIVQCIGVDPGASGVKESLQSDALPTELRKGVLRD